VVFFTIQASMIFVGLWLSSEKIIAKLIFCVAVCDTEGVNGQVVRKVTKALAARTNIDSILGWRRVLLWYLYGINVV